MKKVNIILILIIVTNSLFAFAENNRDDLYIVFGSGYINDTISLSINDISVMEKIVLKSDSIGDVCYNGGVIMRDGVLNTISQDLNEKEILFQYSDKLKIIMTVNGRPYELVANLKKGKYIVISKHWYYYNVYLNQFKRPVSSE